MLPMDLWRVIILIAEVLPEDCLIREMQVDRDSSASYVATFSANKKRSAVGREVCGFLSEQTSN
jgi:hypothetical protein